jgi:exodeoxyribonuclease-1
VPEHEFAARSRRRSPKPGTVGVGYNTIRFDDEVTRFLFWRNLLDPYAREWQNNCGRWDLLDVVRMTYALRPEGIEWPTHPDGRPSFRLEDLTRANGLSHESAHDALSDVRATIALARLIRSKQPRLFDFCLELRRKDKVASEMGLHLQRDQRQPFLHVSGMFPAEHGCLGAGLAAGPASEQQERNPGVGLPSRSVGAVRPRRRDDPPAHVHAQRRFAGRRDAPADQERAPEQVADAGREPENLEPGDGHALGRRPRPGAAPTRNSRRMGPTWRPSGPRSTRSRRATALDVDEDLYGGFVSNNDRRKLESLRMQTPAQLAAARPSFEDERLAELLLRYRARNFPETLSEAEAQNWEEHRAARLFDGAGGARTVDELFGEIDALSETADERGEEILGALYEYAEAIAPEA